MDVFGQSYVLERERKLPFRLDKVTMGPLSALLLGFTFSFAWTPCVGPALSSVLLLAGTTGNATKGMGLILVYMLGFVLPFLAVGKLSKTVVITSFSLCFLCQQLCSFQVPQELL